MGLADRDPGMNLGGCVRVEVAIKLACVLRLLTRDNVIVAGVVPVGNDAVLKIRDRKLRGCERATSANSTGKPHQC